MTSSPMISVAIPTCNRPEDLQRCLESLARVSYPSWELLVIDQSDDARSQCVVTHLADRLPDLHYHRMTEKGLTRARNLVLRTARTEIVAFLDDDCTVETDWLDQIAVTFDRHPEAAIIFGTVQAVPHDRRRSLVPEYLPTEERVLQGRQAFLSMGNVMGASMHVQRSLCKDVGPYDVHAGPGAALRATEDHDYAYRVLAAGRSIVTTPAILVRHYGARPFSTGAARHLVRSNALAYGAMDMKFLRCGDLVALRLITSHLIMYFSGVNPARLLRRRGPSNLGQPIMYARGLFIGTRLPIIKRYRLWGRDHDYEPNDLPGSATSVQCPEVG